MRINYQIMEEGNRTGAGETYIPDFNKLLANATDDAERQVIEEAKSLLGRRGNGFAYNLVYITKQKCGHYEIFQAPCNDWHPLDDKLRLAEEHAKTSDCTSCICKW